MRGFIKLVLLVSLYVVRSVLDLFAHFREVAILCYHSIGDTAENTTISADTLSQQLAYLQSKGHSFVSLDDVITYVYTEKGLTKKAIALTFDDGYDDFETAALPVLEQFKAPATLFLVGQESVARVNLGTAIPLLTQEAVERLRAHPLVTLGYHSRTHANFKVLSEEQLAAEVAPPSGETFFAYPGGNYSIAAIEAVKKAGYKAAVSIKPTLVTHSSNVYLLPRNVVTKNMTLSQVHARVTKAVDWYRAFTQI